MIKLEYINRHTTNKWVPIGIFKSFEDVTKNIIDFAKDHNFIVGYIREWTDEDGYTLIDFGSHSQFYRIKEIVE